MTHWSTIGVGNADEVENEFNELNIELNTYNTGASMRAMVLQRAMGLMQAEIALAPNGVAS
jgi:hypothetical protein